MSTEVRVPALPESVSDATILAWHHQPGESVNQDENLVDLETDKVVLEVPAPVDGVLQEIRFKDGETVQADDLLAIIEAGAGRAAAPTRPPVTEPPPSRPGRLPKSRSSPRRCAVWSRNSASTRARSPVRARMAGS